MARNSTVSRCGKYAVAWGKDHACGWFIQVFDLTVEDHSDPAHVVLDKDELFDGIGLREVLEVASAYNAGDAVEREIYGIG